MTNLNKKQEFVPTQIPGTTEDSSMLLFPLPPQYEIFETWDKTGSAKFVTGSEILFDILWKNSISNESELSEIKINLRDLQDEYDELFIIREPGHEPKTNVDMIIQLYELTDDRYSEDELLMYASELRSNAVSIERQHIALAFERFVRFMYLKEKGELPRLIDAMQNE
jgi:hypothetical protein